MKNPDLIRSVIFISLIFLSAKGFSFLFLIGITLQCAYVFTHFWFPVRVSVLDKLRR